MARGSSIRPTSLRISRLPARSNIGWPVRRSSSDSDELAADCDIASCCAATDTFSARAMATKTSSWRSEKLSMVDLATYPINR